MVEHQPSKLIVRVRFPSPAPIGGIPERPKGADCKSAVADFDGSNPSPTTIFEFKDLLKNRSFLYLVCKIVCKVVCKSFLIFHNHSFNENSLPLIEQKGVAQN